MTVQDQLSSSESLNASPYTSALATKLSYDSQPKHAKRSQQTLPKTSQDQYQDTSVYTNGKINYDLATAMNQYSSSSTLNEMPAVTPMTEFRSLNVTDALAYLDQVKTRFCDKLNVYNQFLDVIKDFKSQSIDTPGVIERVSALFKDHPNLIIGFNTFLPSGYKIEYSNNPRDPNHFKITTPSNGPFVHESQHHPNNHASQHNSPSPSASQDIPSRNYAYNKYHYPSEFDRAVEFVNKIKARCIHAPNTYAQFLQLIRLYQEYQIEASVFYSTFCQIFQNYDDILEEFNLYLPGFDDSTTAGKKRKSPHNHDELPSAQAKRRMTNSNITDEEHLSTTSSDELFVSAGEIHFFDRVKKHIGNRPSYEEFLKTINLFTQQIFDVDTVVKQVSVFLGDNAELFAEFKSILGYEERMSNSSNIIPKPDSKNCEAVEESPSYRKVPMDWQTIPCSGRDELCWEVLNDSYVSHPLWENDESDFSAINRNVHEDELHRCEEERYEYDMLIEASISTIALLEPISRKIEKMIPKEQKYFKMKPGLGQSSAVAYTHVIKKIYGDERGAEIIELLYENPVTVVPVLIKRLKHKLNEWREGRKENGKLWKEEEAKNFYRSLDYQSTSFKEKERKLLTPKAIQQEAEKLQLEEAEFIFEQLDQNISKDISQLVNAYMGKQSNGFSKSELHKIKCIIDDVATLLQDEQLEKEVVAEENALKNDQADTTDVSHDKTPNTNEQCQEATPDNKSSTKLTSWLSTVSKDHKTKTTQLTCKIEFYSVFRLYKTLYERLLNIKTISELLKADFEVSRKPNQIAIDLGLVDDQFEEINIANGQYAAMLEVAGKFLDGRLDQQKYEDQARFISGPDAHTLFTIDKTIQLLLKQIKAYV